MELQTETVKDFSAIKIMAVENGVIIGRAHLYILKNELHPEPFGFLEDVFVEEEHRKKGIGSKLIEKVIVEAKNQGCYKLICTARLSKPEVHAFYEKFGFKRHGFEFRMDLS